MNRRVVREGFITCLAAALVVCGGMQLAGQSAGQVFPASEEMAKLGIQTYRVTSGTGERERHVEADLLGTGSEVIGRIEILNTRGLERATLRWKGESITLVVHQDHRYELLHEGRRVVADEKQVTAESDEFFRLHAERIEILRVAGGELWALAASRAGKSQGKACGQSETGDDVSVAACSGDWTWDCSWNVRIFRTWACTDARTRTGEECSGRRCLGCCAFGDCNCTCMGGDFSCFCCVDGQRCGAP